MERITLKTFIVLGLVLSLCWACASPRKWTPDEKKAALAFMIAHTANAYSTERHQDYPEYFYERNRILGNHPSDVKIGTYFALTGIGGIIIAHYIPSLRISLLGSYAIINTRYAINDINLVKDGR